MTVEVGLRRRRVRAIVATVALGATVFALAGRAEAQTDDATGITATVQYEDASGERVRVEGAELLVEDESGEEVETAVTNADGQATVALPGAGDYTVTLDTDTLPDGLIIVAPDGGSITINVGPQESRPVIFTLEPTDDETAIRTTLQYQDTPGSFVPVEGAEIQVEDVTGAEIGTAETDADGEAMVILPGAGEFTVTLDADSLPDGVALRDPEEDSHIVDVVRGQTQPVIFFLEPADEEAPESGDDEAEVASADEDEAEEEGSSTLVFVVVAVVLVASVLLVIILLRRRSGNPQQF